MYKYKTEYKNKIRKKELFTLKRCRNRKFEILQA